ncbi:MAG: YihY/virulence factor BrkB family protein, partial [Actinomycetota bacterium]|nr:YihY/virulence factor BrkB family protein [Actinomycetota bacterium]
RSPGTRNAATVAEAKRPQPRGLVRKVARLTADVWRKSDRDRILGLAGENAFMGVLTLFPTLIVFAALMGQLSSVIGEDNTAQVKQSISDFLLRVLTNSAEDVDGTVRTLFSYSGKTLTVALMIALASVAQSFASVINTITLAYELEDHRGWWFRRWLGLLLGLGTLAAGAIILSAFVIGPLLGHADQVVAKVGLSEEYSFIWAWIRYPVGFVALIAWATTLFHLCPDRQARWRSGLPGGLLTSVMWVAASLGFSSYLALVVPRSPVLGALGGGLILMTWFYLLFLSLLIGAELNATLLVRKRLSAEAPAAKEHGGGALGVDDEDTDHL